KPIERRPEYPQDLGVLTRLSFDEVVFRHNKANMNAIDGVSFQIRAGETIEFVGQSGPGKPTLVKLLFVLYRPKSGRILFNQYPSTEIRYNELRRQIGFVTQDTQLFAGTIRDNLLFVKGDATDHALREALHKASCDALLQKSEKGLDTVLGEG